MNYQTDQMPGDAGFGIVPRNLRGRVSARALAVFLALTWRANHEGRCFMKWNTLAKDSGQSRNSAMRGAEELRDAALLRYRQHRNPDGAVVAMFFEINIYQRHDSLPYEPVASQPEARVYACPVRASRVGAARVGVPTYARNRAGRRDLGRRQVNTPLTYAFLPSRSLHSHPLSL